MTVKKQGIGEVHAPVEDTDVPPSLKLIVFILLLGLIVLGTIVMLMANYFGIFVL